MHRGPHAIHGRTEGADAERTFEEVVTQHLDALYRTALRLTRGRTADAEDLLQDAVLRAFEAFGELREPGAARAWLFTTLVRTHLNRRRAATRRREDLACDLGDHEFEQALAAWPAGVMRDERGDGRPDPADVAEAIDALDEPLRSVVVLVDVEGFRQREAAAMLRLPEGTVASRLFRARRQLRETLLDRSAAGRSAAADLDRRR